MHVADVDASPLNAQRLLRFSGGTPLIAGVDREAESFELAAKVLREIVEWISGVLRKVWQGIPNGGLGAGSIDGAKVPRLNAWRLPPTAVAHQPV